MQKMVYTQQELSVLLGHNDPHWFARNKQRLFALGFPPPLVGVGQPRWSKRQVDAWIESGGMQRQSGILVSDGAGGWDQLVSERLDEMGGTA